MKALTWTLIILMYMGGILAISGLIVGKKPDAKQIIDRLVPFQALIGVGLLAVAIILWLKIGLLAMLKGAGANLGATAGFALVAASIVLGFLFGMPQIAKWLPGQSAAEQKAMEIAQKLGAFQVLIGAVGLVAATISLLYLIGVLKYAVL